MRHKVPQCVTLSLRTLFSTVLIRDFAYTLYREDTLRRIYNVSGISLCQVVNTYRNCFQGTKIPNGVHTFSVSFHHCKSFEKYFASGILIFGPQLLSASFNEELGFIYLFIYLFSDCQSRFFDYCMGLRKCLYH